MRGERCEMILRREVAEEQRLSGCTLGTRKIEACWQQVRPERINRSPKMKMAMRVVTFISMKTETIGAGGRGEESTQ